MKDVAFITVQYNNPADTEIFLRSVGRLSGVANCEVVVVDNSDAPSARRDPEAAPNFPVHTMRPGKNLFYWGGAAFALESRYTLSGPWPTWIVVCNNDVEIVDEDFLQKLRALDPATHPIIAPSILSRATGKDQNPILEGHPGSLKKLKWRLYDLSYPIARSLLAIHAAGSPFRTSSTAIRPESQTARRVYAPHGACVIFSSAFFQKGGELDTAVPLFAEELTIAALAEKLSMPIWYRPDLRISHREHSTTGHQLTREKYEMERMARRRYYSFGK